MYLGIYISKFLGQNFPDVQNLHYCDCNLILSPDNHVIFRFIYLTIDLAGHLLQCLDQAVLLVLGIL